VVGADTAATTVGIALAVRVCVAAPGGADPRVGVAQADAAASREAAIGVASRKDDLEIADLTGKAPDGSGVAVRPAGVAQIGDLQQRARAAILVRRAVRVVKAGDTSGKGILGATASEPGRSRLGSNRRGTLRRSSPTLPSMSALGSVGRPLIDAKRPPRTRAPKTTEPARELPDIEPPEG